MDTPHEILKRSLSDLVIILSYMDAMDLIDIISTSDNCIDEWTALERQADSNKFFELARSPESLATLPIDAACALSKSTIMQAYSIWQSRYEDNRQFMIELKPRCPLRNEEDA